MLRSTDGILTTHSGLLPPPGGESLKSTLGRMTSGGGVDADVLDAAITEGIDKNIAAQREIGIDVMSDGEFYKAAILDQGYYDRFTSITSRATEPGELTWAGANAPENSDPQFARLFEHIRAHGNTDVDINPPPAWAFGGGGKRFVCNGPLVYRGHDQIKHEVERSRAAAEAAGVDVSTMFYPLVGPSWFSHFVFNEYYETEQEYLFALGDAIHEEVQVIVDAGFIVQLDEPALVDLSWMLNPTPSVKEYREIQEVRVEATNRAIGNIPEDRVRMHVCWGSHHWPHTRDIPLKEVADLMLKVNAQAYDIESASVTHELNFQVWEDLKLPEGKLLIPGMVSHMTSGRIEPPELVAHRIIQYADVVGRENVIAGVDCGPGSRCHDDVAWAKLKALTAGAKLASEKLWPNSKS